MAYLWYRLRHLLHGRQRPMSRAEFRTVEHANELLRDSGAVQR